MTKILICGYYGLDNIGDEAILSGMLNSLKDYIDSPEFYVVTNNPDETHKLHGITSVKQTFKEGFPRFLVNSITTSEVSSIFRHIHNCDIFILGGGSLLQDLKAYYLPVLLSLLSYANNIKKKTVIYGIGAGPINTMLGKKLINKVLNKTDLITVRDSMSKKVLESCGIKNVIQTADPAFNIPITMKPSIRLNSEGSDGAFGSTLYNWLHDSDIYRNPGFGASDLLSRRKNIAKLYSRINDKFDKNIFLVPTVSVDYDGYLDIAKHTNSSRIYVAKYDNNINSLLFRLSQFELLIGMRLHSLILASILGVPFVPISYCGKTKSYLDLMDINDLYLDIENLESTMFQQVLCQNIKKVYSNKSSYSTKLLNKSAKLKERCLLNAKLVADLTS